MKRLICCLKDRRGSSFTFVIAVTLVLMLIMCGFLEFYRLKIIANGVRDAAQEAIMITVNDNYANVYHGVREGYSGGYQPNNGGFKYSVDKGNVLSKMDKILGTKVESGRHVKYTGGVLEYSISDLSVTARNAPLAPGTPENEQRFEIDAIVTLKVPVQFAGKRLPEMKIRLKVQAGYIEVF